MIAPLAVSLALSFWAPYNHGQPVCPQGVKIHQVGFGQTPGPSFIARDPETGVLIPQCEMFADSNVSHWPIEYQAAWVARNIGAGYFGLSPSADKRNIMYADGWVFPATLRPKIKSRRRD